MDSNQVFFIADTHFGHGNILRYCQRPFLNAAERKLLAEGRDFRVSRDSINYMDTTIINNINAVVGRDDVLWHVGDFTFADYQAARKYRDRIICQNIYLIWGNHDKEQIRDLFTDCHEQITIEVDDRSIYLNHYPKLSWDGSSRGTWMLHGHVHGNVPKDPEVRALSERMPICDVGVDGPCITNREGVYNHTFKPWSMSELRRFMEQKSTGALANASGAERVSTRIG